MNQTLQIGLVGCGTMGRILAPAVPATGLGRIRTVFDVDPAKSAALAQDSQAEVSPTEEQLFDNPDLEAVILAVPPYLHKESVLKAASMGKHIFLLHLLSTSPDDQGCNTYQLQKEQVTPALF